MSAKNGRREGERGERREEKVVEREEEGEEKGRATSPREQGGREGCLLVIRQTESERVRVSQRESLYIFHGTGFHDCVSPECEAR